MPLKRVDELKPGDRIRMKIGHATVIGVESLDDDRTPLAFAYGTKGAADNDLTVDVLDDDEWGWEDENGSTGSGQPRRSD